MNAKLLEQSRLDVSEKSRSNIFNWRGQFTPQFIEYLVDTFSSSHSLVVDPFCGSGTVLLEAAAKQLPAVGCEINPAAYAMSKFIAFSNLPIVARHQVFQQVQNEVSRIAKAHNDIPIHEEGGNYRSKYKNLLACASDLFKAMGQKAELLLALIVMMRAESNGRGTLSHTLHKACASVRDDLTNLPFSSSKIDVVLCDARETHKKCCATADLIVTSPPYINVFNYHQNYRALLEVLGFDMLRVAESEIGSNRKNRGNRFRTVVQYALDMEQCLVSFGLSLRTGGTLILIVGHESNVRGIPFSNSEILRQIAASLGCFRFEGERHRVFINRFGKSIRENILVLHLSGDVPVPGSARQIAENHLKDAMQRAEGEPRNDIIATLSDLPAISASPLFS